MAHPSHYAQTMPVKHLDHIEDLHSTVAIAWSAQQWIGRDRWVLMQQDPFIAYVDRSPAEQREALLGAGLAPLVADLLVGLDSTKCSASL